MTLPQLAVPLGGRVSVPRQDEAPSTTSPPSRPAATRAAAYGICLVCHGPAAAGTTRCWSCREVVGQLGMPPPKVVPICLFELGSPVHRALVGYKAAVSPAGRRARTEALARMLAAFLRIHFACLLEPRGPVEPLGAERAKITPVPSSIGGRPSWHGQHPLATICAVAAALMPELGELLEPSLLLRPGPCPPGRLAAMAEGFLVTEAAEVAGTTVVVVDDVFTSGARALSAAAALQKAGARVAAVVPLGRLVRPEHNAATAAFWATQQSRRYRIDECTACRREAVAQAPAALAWQERRHAIVARIAA
jgi:hypothetical protein